MRISDWSSDVCSSDLHRIAAEDEMIEAERCRDDIDRGDHPARAIIPVGRRAREAVAGQVEGDDAVIAAQPLGQRLPRLEAAVRSVEEQHHRSVARALVAIVNALRSAEHTSELQSLKRISYAV